MNKETRERMHTYLKELLLSKNEREEILDHIEVLACACCGGKYHYSNDCSFQWGARMLAKDVREEDRYARVREELKTRVAIEKERTRSKRIWALA